MPAVRSARSAAGARARPLLVLVALATVAAGCASAGPDRFYPGPHREEASLGDAEIAAVAEVLMREDHRAFDEEAFERLAEVGSVEVRRRAVTAAGRIGDPAAVPFLLRALTDDPAPAVRADAAFALGEVGDTSAAVVEALGRAAPSYWVPVRDPEVAVVVEVLGALGKIGTAAAGRLVADALLETRGAVADNARRIAAEALLAAWRFGTAVSVPGIAPFLASEDPAIRWRAAYALMRSGRPAGLPHLLGAIRDDEHRVRAYAARALAREPAVEAGVADSALIVLTAALGDEHPHVRINALGALGSYGDEAPFDAIAARLYDADANAAIAAAASLARLGTRAAVPLADAAADPQLPVGVRGAALERLGPLDRARASFLLGAMAGGSVDTRYLAARALAGAGLETASDVLPRLVDDADPRVAIAALGAAATLAADTSVSAARRAELRPLLLRALEHDQPRVAAVAAAALAPVAAREDVPRLLAAYDRAAGADAPAERAAAIAVVETLGALEDTRGGAADAFFARTRPSTDRWVRRAVADTLGAGWGSPPPAVASPDLAFYEDVVRRHLVGPLTGEDRPHALIRTASGVIQVELLADEAPLTVANFIDLARAGYYDDGVWHRVVPNFVLQDGAPGGYASGGPGWAIRDEINRVRYGRGAVGMALAGPDTGGSQWFITHSPQPHLDGGYTVFGLVSDGMEVADRVVQGEPILSIRIR